jgi:hypothetical protein
MMWLVRPNSAEIVPNVRPIVLPASAPTMISISATETATRIETIEANSARPIHKADCS